MPSGNDSGRKGISVCLVEYNPLAARYLEQLLAGDSFQLLFHEEVFRSKRAAARAPVSVFLLDRGSLPMPLSKFLRFVRLHTRDAKTLVLDDPQPQPELFRLLFLGIQGFVSYQEAPEVLPQALRSVAEGHLWVDPEVLHQYVRYSSALSRHKATRGDALTGRERHIIELVQRRMSNREISSILAISESTVKFHLTNIFAKLGVSDREAVVELASSRPASGLLPQKSK